MKGSVYPGLKVGLAVCALGTFMACIDLTGLRGLQFTFEASPDTVAPGDSVDLVFTLRNHTRYAMTIRSSYGCLFFLESLRGDEPVYWQGMDYGCAAAFTNYTILPGDSLHWVQELVAAEAGGTGSPPLPAATYRIRTRMNADLPDLETEVTVMPSTQDN